MINNVRTGSVASIIAKPFAIDITLNKTSRFVDTTVLAGVFKKVSL